MALSKIGGGKETEAQAMNRFISSIGNFIDQVNGPSKKAAIRSTVERLVPALEKLRIKIEDGAGICPFRILGLSLQRSPPYD